MDLLENITVKQKPAGATDRDLPWWFEIYHIAWILFFPVMWYFFGAYVFFPILFIVAFICIWQA
jgi:hypothetical protein